MCAIRGAIPATRRHLAGTRWGPTVLNHHNLPTHFSSMLNISKENDARSNLTRLSAFLQTSTIIYPLPDPLEIIIKNELFLSVLLEIIEMLIYLFSK